MSNSRFEIQNAFSALHGNDIEMIVLTQSAGLYSLAIQRTTGTDTRALQTVTQLIHAQQDFPWLTFLLDLLCGGFSGKEHPAHEDFWRLATERGDWVALDMRQKFYAVYDKLVGGMAHEQAIEVIETIWNLAQECHE